MVYQDFIRCIEQHQTARVTALAISESCSMQSIPKVILSLIPNMIEILDKKHHHFSANNEIIAIFGLQPCLLAIKSEFPKTSKRIINKERSDNHLCCVLKYVSLSREQLAKQSTWLTSHDLIIDFTTGNLMDHQYYLSQVIPLSAQGTIFSVLDNANLHAVWQKISTNYHH